MSLETSHIFRRRHQVSTSRTTEAPTFEPLHLQRQCFKKKKCGGGGCFDSSVNVSGHHNLKQGWFMFDINVHPCADAFKDTDTHKPLTSLAAAVSYRQASPITVWWYCLVHRLLSVLTDTSLTQTFPSHIPIMYLFHFLRWNLYIVERIRLLYDPLY